MKPPKAPRGNMKMMGNARPTSGPKIGSRKDMTPAKNSGSKRAGGKVC